MYRERDRYIQCYHRNAHLTNKRLELLRVFQLVEGVCLLDQIAWEVLQKLAWLTSCDSGHSPIVPIVRRSPQSHFCDSVHSPIRSTIFSVHSHPPIVPTVVINLSDRFERVKLSDSVHPLKAPTLREFTQSDRTNGCLISEIYVN